MKKEGNINYIKIMLLAINILLLAACTPTSNDSHLNPNDYGQSMEFIVDNFEINYEPDGGVIPKYIQEYDVRNVSSDIVMAVNSSSQISYLEFDHMTTEDAKLVLNDIGVNINEDLELLLDDVDSFEAKYDQSYLVYDLENFGIHIFGFNSEFSEQMNREEPYRLSIFYNKNIFESFLK